VCYNGLLCFFQDTDINFTGWTVFILCGIYLLTREETEFNLNILIHFTVNSLQFILYININNPRRRRRWEMQMYEINIFFQYNFQGLTLNLFYNIFLI
jgi:hypothetical protein